jgi:hypothetical protein
MNIVPINIWSQGQTIQATQINVDSVWDNLLSEAKFLYQLFSSTNVLLDQGNVVMPGSDYTNWDNSNLAAYQYVCGKLNITLI